MFAKNDLVVVVGSTKTKTKKTKVLIEIAEVIEVGAHELIVQPMANSSWRRRAYRISKQSCSKIPTSNMKTHIRRIAPKLGDLVMYYNTDYSGDITRKVGILIEHTDYPGKEPGGVILCDGETQEYPMTSLMILDPEDPIKSP